MSSTCYHRRPDLNHQHWYSNQLPGSWFAFSPDLESGLWRVPLSPAGYRSGFRGSMDRSVEEKIEKKRGDGCSVREREKGIGKNKNGDNFGGRVFEMVICFVSIVFLSLNYSFKNCIISSNYTCVYL